MTDKLKARNLNFKSDLVKEAFGTSVFGFIGGPWSKKKQPRFNNVDLNKSKLSSKEKRMAAAKNFWSNESYKPSDFGINPGGRGVNFK